MLIFHAVGYPSCDSNATLSDTVAGETVFYNCQTTYSGLWAPVMEWWDNWGDEHTPINATDDIQVNYSVTLKVTPGDTGRQLETQMFFGPPPDGAIPSSDDKNYWANNAPTYKTCHTFDELNVFCK